MAAAERARSAAAFPSRPQGINQNLAPLDQRALRRLPLALAQRPKTHDEGVRRVSQVSRIVRVLWPCIRRDTQPLGSDIAYRQG